MAAVTDAEGTTRSESSTSDADPEHTSQRVATRQTHWWYIGLPAALLATGSGIVVGSPALLLIGVVGAGVLVYRGLTTVPSPVVDIQRSITPADPDPGETVIVRTTVENVGDQLLPDLRVIDRAPEELVVTDGSARGATALRPGDQVTLEYTLEAKAGYHEFEGVTLLVRDLAGREEVEYRVEETDELTTRPDPTPLPVPVLRELTTPYAGQQTTDEPAEGIQFHSVREYRPEDSVRRVDWNRYASTGDLTTIQFHSQRRASVVIVADLRSEALRRPTDGTQHTGDYTLTAVSQLFVSLLDAGHQVGLATLGSTGWLAPGTGDRHRTQGLELLGEDPAFAPTDHGTQPLRIRLRQLRRQFPDRTQVVFVSPVIDDEAVIAVRSFEAGGNASAVIAPDPTDRTTPEQTVASLERRERLREITRLGVPAVDWTLDDSLAIAIAQAQRGARQ